MRRLFNLERLSVDPDVDDKTIHNIRGQVTKDGVSGSGSLCSHWTDSLLFQKFHLIKENMSGRKRSKQSKLPWVAIYFDKVFIGLRQLFKGKKSTRPGHGNERALRIGFDECETAEVPMTCRTNMNNKIVVKPMNTLSK